MKSGFVTAALFAALTFPTLAPAREHDGVQMADPLTLAGKSLRLNGMGTRRRRMPILKTRAYVGGLYLEIPTDDAKTAVASDQVKQIRIQFTHDLDRGEISRELVHCWDHNSKRWGKVEEATFDKLIEWLPAAHRGDVWEITYVPGVGTTVATDPKSVWKHDGKAFADALFAVWLGPRPPTEELRKGMLGMATP